LEEKSSSLRCGIFLPKTLPCGQDTNLLPPENEAENPFSNIINNLKFTIMYLRDLVPGDTFTIGKRGKTVYSLEYNFKEGPKGGMQIKALKSGRIYYVDPYTAVSIVYFAHLLGIVK
jgi:hypothetical protein